MIYCFLDNKFIEKSFFNKILTILFFMTISILYSYTAHANNLLYEVMPNTPIAEGNTAVPIQLNALSPRDLADGSKVNVPFPITGESFSGEVARTIKGAGKTNADGARETSRTIISLDQGQGSVTLITHRNAFTNLLLYMAKDNKLYTSTIDSNGRGLLKEEDVNTYQCADYPLASDTGVQNISKVADLIPDVNTLKNLESKPGASKTLYIDYWGGTISGTAWNDNFNNRNPIAYTPFSNDSDTSTFSSAERYLMWLGWRETAEDYATFDINVTTKQSVYDSTAIVNRSRIIATQTNYFYTGAGGVAYVGIFDNSIDYYKTGWAWNNGAGSLGMTIAHEAGHQIGLYHDGTSIRGYYSGHGVWGPIMGAPFGKPYVQWSIGEYPDANNNENDLSIAAGVLGVSADDAGNTTATATTLSLPVSDQEGHIQPDGLSADIDVYKFSLATVQAVDITVQPLLGDENEERAANLAINVALQDSSNNVIHSITSADTSPLKPTTNIFTYNSSLNAGTYYLIIDAVSPDTNWSTGFGEYANEGVYRFTVDANSSGTPEITTPTPGSTLSGATETFTWTDNGTSVSQYWLYVGRSAGAKDIYDSRNLSTATSDTVTTLPTDGSTLHVRLWYKSAGSWLYTDYTYTAASGGSDPEITTPAPNSTLSGATETFTWVDNGTSVSQYWLYIGRTVGARDIYDSGDLGTATSDTVTVLPIDSSTVYVRFWYNSGGWRYQDYTYTAGSGSNNPEIVSPAPGSTLSNASETFIWRPNSVTVGKYWFYAGSSVGAKDIYDSGNLGTALSTTVSGLPLDGSTLYIRFWYYVGVFPIAQEGETIESNVQAGSWYYVDYTYVSAQNSGFDEQFNGDISNWTQHSGSWTNANSRYLYTTGVDSSRARVTYTSETYSDLDYSARLWRAGADLANAITIRSDATSASTDGYCNNCYLFQYLRDGRFSVWKRVNGAWTALQNWVDSAALNQDSAWNKLRVKAVGSDFEFYINDTLVWSGSDSSHSSGRVGIQMYKDASTVDKLWVDWATLVMPSATAAGIVSEEQQQLNDAANASSGTYDPDRASEK